MIPPTPVESGSSEQESQPTGAPPAVAWRPVLLIAGTLGAVLLVFSARYGYHRDELYFRVAARHLDWGYPDQPPLVPLLARAITAVFGDSLVMLRVPSALAAAAGVVVAALTARELGGAKRAQLLTAGAYAVCPFAVAIGHLLSTATFDVLLSTVVAWLAVRWVRTRDQRLLLAIGAVAGLAVNVKYLAGMLLAALVAGLLLAGPRDFLRRPMLFAGAAVLVLAAVPGLLWQARHGWPQLEMSERIAEEGDFGGRAGFVPFQLLLTGVVLSWLWIYGLWRLLRSPDLARHRFLGYGYLLLCALFLVTAGKPYYLAGLWAALWAAGAVEVERRGAPRGWGWAVSVPAYAITAVVTVATTLPVYPVDRLADTPQPAINADASETVGWPRFAAEVARVHRSLPPDERSRAIILTANYGEAGALDLYGPDLGLPRPYSAHNGYWYFGRPADTGGPVIVVGPEGSAALQRHWTEVTVAGRIDNGVGLDNDEQGLPVWVCRGQREPWAVLWPRLKHLS
ncbi:Dolichyl-phosphate-mannose-protein mannosyltransferase [Thermomonospora echinospora]|uniref:Dolichyl-phosphate-mannose-protein mannosyltransferase n=1 Tax=Thermomonospora echinospora TaxID=1992 RepID=A0A1H6E2V8_9ACTN|nr:glycosyltransferase family 39 protein [Thermomonospora echinospora]SEG92048.1 Dolichyl-phosphate-mannose-protein mannosyltransferase [Thermomonospora echinospora]